MFADQQYDEPSEVETIAEYLAADTSEPPSDPDLLPFWRYKRSRHAREFRMQDVIGHNFAAIWLTEEEFRGRSQPAAARRQWPAPRQSAADLASKKAWPNSIRLPDRQLQRHRGDIRQILVPVVWTGTRNRAPRLRHRDVGTHRRSQCGTAAARPSAAQGRTRRLHRTLWQAGGALRASIFLRPQPSRRHHVSLPVDAAIQRDLSRDREHSGGFNFGGGNAQLDLETMAFDWACG